MELPELQVAILEAASATDPMATDELADDLDAKPTAVTRAVFELRDAGLVDVVESTTTTLDLSDEGRDYREEGLPERRLFRAVLDVGGDEQPAPMDAAIQAAGLDGDQVDVALANYTRKGLGEIDRGEITADPTAATDTDPEADALDQLPTDASGVQDSVLDRLIERGLVVRDDVTERSVTLTDDGVDLLMTGSLEVAETVGALTPDLLTSGEWRDVELTEYNVEADAQIMHGGREHVLRQTAERVKDVLVGMGFEEMAGPHADAQFWINDCLFMPQDHPARTHWDQFALAAPAEIETLPADLVERVRSAHRDGVGPDGEGYHSPWRESVARTIDLRGHTTSLSMRYLSGHEVGDLDPPERYFSVEKVYRNDTLDPTHLLEFFQIEGWVMADGLSVRDLMGTFTEFYAEFGITDLEFKPHYNPYTEPSFELFGTHPVSGELVEVGNSGLFREEVLGPLGVEVDVMAWGLSLERLLMLMYGFEDIRDVHGTLCDLEQLRSAEVVY